MSEIDKFKNMLERKLNCPHCATACCVEPEDFIGIEGHHPNCRCVNEAKSTFKISHEGNGFLTHNPEEFFCDMSSEIGDSYVVTRVSDMSAREIHELPEFTGF